MSLQGRSLDDLPLAAYTTGVVPAEEDRLDPAVDPDLVAAPALTQQDLAAALVETTAPGDAPAPTSLRRRPRPSLKLPSLRRSKAAAVDGMGHFQPVSHPSDEPAAFEAAAEPVAPSLVFQPVDAPEVPTTPPATPPALAGLRVPRRLARDPRLLAGGVLVVAAALVGLNLLGGGEPATGSTGPNGSQNPGAVLPTAAPGAATVELTAALKGTFTLTGSSGAGGPVDGQLAGTWTDARGNSLGLTGAASQGTRTTDATFVLTWTMLIDNHRVTFTSRGSECTVGMAVRPQAVLGTFNCKRLKSGDGKRVLDLRGSYTT